MKTIICGLSTHYLFILMHSYLSFFRHSTSLLLNCNCAGTRKRFRIERRQVVFLRWDQDSKLGVWGTHSPADGIPTHKPIGTSRINWSTPPLGLRSCLNVMMIYVMPRLPIHFITTFLLMFSQITTSRVVSTKVMVLPIFMSSRHISK